MSEQTAANPIEAAVAVPDHVIEHGGQKYLKNSRGGLDPVESINTRDLLMDEVVRKVVGYALPLSKQIVRFKHHSFDDVDKFVELLAQNYGAKRGGKKGNLSLNSYDGLMRVSVAVADNVTFGPELQIAKQLFDECVLEWSIGSHDHIRALIGKAFNTDKEGLVNRSELLSLTRVDIDDEKWKRAVAAIQDAQRIIGSKRYIRVHTRPDKDAAWVQVALDAAV